ncbi:MFS transporter [Nonomuraea mesophila]|uniref:MFS transporter n=1 Tax=Nonomuraea mesophila TaxID=2530382 RepID=A0A4R5FYW4_9ACTN|nr:MFS transporter [Nonomuraea mesophila]
MSSVAGCGSERIDASYPVALFDNHQTMRQFDVRPTVPLEGIVSTRLYPLAAGNFAIGTGMFVTAGLLPPISADLDVSPAAAGQLMTVFALTYAVLSPPLAAVTARMPRRTLLLTGMGVFVLGNALTALAPTYALVLATRVLAAAGAAMFTPTASAVASALSAPERRGRALALVIGGLSLASAIGVPLGTWLGDAASWRATLWLVAGLGVAGFAGVAVLVPDVTIPISGRLKDRFVPLADRRVLAVLGTHVLMFAASFAAYTYLGSLFDLPLAAVLWAWGLGAVVGNQLGGRLTDAYGPRRMILIALVAGTIFLALIPVANLALPVALVWAFLWSALGWLLAPAQQFRTVAAVPDNVPVGLGLLSSAQYLGLFVAGLAGGAALGAFGRPGVIVLSAGLGLAALLFTLVTYRAEAVPVISSRESAPVR